MWLVVLAEECRCVAWNARWQTSRGVFFFFSSRRRHTRFDCDWSSDVCSSDLFRHIGAAARAAKGRALPDAPGHELEWARCDFRAGRRDTDDDRLAPAAMAG